MNAATIVNEFLFHPGEMAKPGFDPSDAVEFWDLVNRQDWAICETHPELAGIVVDEPDDLEGEPRVLVDLFRQHVSSASGAG